MHRPLRLPSLLALLIAAPLAPLAAQGFTATAGGTLGVGIPLGEFSDEARFGTGWDLEGSVRISEMVGAYARYGVTSFRGVDIATIVETPTTTDRGWGAGLMLRLPMSAATATSLAGWAQGGVLIHELEREVGETRTTIDGSTGWELAGGVEIELGGGRFLVRPQARYRSYDAEAETRSASTTVGYVLVGVGVAVVLSW